MPVLTVEHSVHSMTGRASSCDRLGPGHTSTKWGVCTHTEYARYRHVAILRIRNRGCVFLACSDSFAYCLRISLRLLRILHCVAQRDIRILRLVCVFVLRVLHILLCILHIVCIFMCILGGVHTMSISLRVVCVLNCILRILLLFSAYFLRILSCAYFLRIYLHIVHFCLRILVKFLRIMFVFGSKTVVLKEFNVLQNWQEVAAVEQKQLI